MWNANVAYSKGTKNHYFRWQEDIDYKIFNTNTLCESAILFYGSSGCRQLYLLLCKLAMRVSSNKIALDRHYAKYVLQIVPRTLRMQLDILEKVGLIYILEKVGLISLIKGKRRYAYIYLKDYRKYYKKLADMGDSRGYNGLGVILLLMDERKGRAEARNLSLEVIGTIGVLWQMKEVPHLQSLLDNSIVFTMEFCV
ncbi:hypothetical protein [Helicobacter bizzozeronii]|uniref:hypothetical protein n=1 Tax=Helicobacter bizzozeronii TaxID=56877 RepID=UPI001F246502|nr:hypothetical protein [Helicobacter bizzozeronii]